jgi:dihydrofolate reductase
LVGWTTSIHSTPPNLVRHAGIDLGIFGAVARQLLAGGLLDEIVVRIVPVLLGAGVRLYGGGPGLADLLAVVWRTAFR